MGRNKALVEVDGVRMGDRAVAALQGAGCDPIWMAGGGPHVGRELRCPVLPDPVGDAGPLAGVAAALSAAAGANRSWVAVVAVDLPLLGSDLVAELLAATSPRVDVVVARSDRLEPAAAVWSVGASVAVGRVLRNGGGALHEVISSLRHVEVPVATSALRNVNTPDDLAAVMREAEALRGVAETDQYPLGNGDT